jgi:hypothetical protein
MLCRATEVFGSIFVICQHAAVLTARLDALERQRAARAASPVTLVG